MANSWFAFKRFRIEQAGTAMKVSTDGVLLGAWARVETFRRFLDIGTGTGLIALMLAQRAEETAHAAKEIHIDAIEIDRGAARQAAANVAASPWAERIAVRHASLQDFATRPDLRGFYDHIVSNPPYYTNDLRSPDPARDRARNTHWLTYEGLIAATVCLLAPEGIFSVILPDKEAKHFVTLAIMAGLHPWRRTEVSTMPSKPPKRVLLEFGTKIATPETDSLFIGNGTAGEFSEAYRAMTRDFYLDF